MEEPAAYITKNQGVPNTVHYIGVDFSLNSPGICILSKDSCRWISLHRTKNIIANMIKKEGSPFKVLNDTDFVDINIITRKEFSDEYHIKEREKIINAVYFSDLAIELLEPYLKHDTVVGMEGLSFGSSGNSLIDISMTTALFRSGIIKRINPENFFVFSPTTIKKFALKGNCKKDELYERLIEKRKEDSRLSPFINILEQNKASWVKGTNKVENPCSDLIDATWISLFIEENVEKLLKTTSL